MTKKQLITPEPTGARFEHRVWGKHRKARKLLTKLATEQMTERVNDCYLLVDDPAWNAKIRNNTLKIKQLVAERKGFERWTSDRHRTADSVPSPFDVRVLAKSDCVKVVTLSASCNSLDNAA